MFEVVISNDLFFVAVFVSSKSYIYITNEVTPLPKSPQIRTAPEPTTHEPIYENIENGNIVPSDDNKFTIYVNYDFMSMRLLEPDIVEITQAAETVDHCNGDGNDDEEQKCSNDDNDNNNDVLENNSKSMSKTIQCQQISMYIGEKKNPRKH